MLVIFGSKYLSLGFWYLVLVSGTGLITLQYQLYILIHYLHARTFCSAVCLISIMLVFLKWDINLICNKGLCS